MQDRQEQQSIVERFLAAAVRHRLAGRGPALSAGVLLAALAVSGCASHIPPGVAAIDPVTVIATDKTVIDHVAGWTSGEDCSSVRAEQGGHWCVQPYENDPVTQPLYCYRTLGAVSCYAQPSNHPADKLIGVQDGGRQRTW